MNMQEEIKEQKNFIFSEENLLKAKNILAKYPKEKSRSALLPLLDIAQRQNDNYLSVDVIEYVADLVGISYMQAYEVASFYTMFNLKPVGKYHIQICGTTPCWLRGSDKIKQACSSKLNIDYGETSPDGLFTLTEVECLGACVNAPMVQINDNYYEDLDHSKMNEIIDKLKNGESIKVGSQLNRISSEPVK